MTTKALVATVPVLAATLMAAPAQTNQTTSTASQPVVSAAEQIVQDIKNPATWLSFGGDLRLRNEYYNNGLSLTTDHAVSPLFGPVHEQDYFRMRGRVWTSIAPTTNLSFNARLAAEPRDFMKPSYSDTFFGREGMQWRYGILDNLNVQWKEPFDLPATFTVGRQDIFLGDGWLVGDGTPNDGSFTFFLDAARLTVDLKDQHTTIDAIGLVQSARPDAWLPTIGQSTTAGAYPEPLSLTDQNEKGAILWVANKSIPSVNLDGFFIYKHDTRINDAPSLLFGDNADIFTVGGSVSGVLKDHWKYSAEGAYQFGQKEDPFLNGIINGNNPLLTSPGAQATGFRDISAFGVNSKLTYLFKDNLNTQFGLSYEFLSGDDPNTKNDEMFDVLWGRWPRWSEVYNIYSQIQESRVGQTANLHRIGPTLTLTPMKDLDLSASYYVLLADQAVATRSDYLAEVGEVVTGTGKPAPGVAAPSPFSNDGGIFRGHYLQAVLKYKFSRHLSAHLWSEFVFPGDYYTSRDLITFLRAELMFTL
ncbi:MAG TPA: alginate export family protein [Dongiaceae bacterium]|nr:alginate export family protein [Dongiaceae bacterium]